MIDQPTYNALYERFQRQVSIPNCPDKLSDAELDQLILAMQADSATAGQRMASKSTGKTKTKVPIAPPSAGALQALLAKAQELTKGGQK